MMENRLLARSVFTVACLACALALSAQPQTTLIEDTIYRADGTKFDGIALIEWRSFLASDYSSVPAYNKSVRIVDGVLKVSLVPTTTASPRAYYIVRFVVNGRVQSTQYWAVPPSSMVKKIKDIQLPGPPPAGSTSGQPSNDPGPVTIDNVIGLPDELASRAKKGIGYAASRVAVINSSGDLEGAVGQPTDCVRANGTVGPCDVSTPPTFVDNEVPAGQIDGSNTTFTLADAPTPPSSLQIFRNGVFQKPGLDYSLSGNVVNFTTIAVPQVGDVLLASYRLSGSGQAGAAAGGALTGYFPSPSLAPGAVADLHIAANAAIAESKLALNFPTHSPANDPSSDQKLALAGTSGTPSGSNRYVTDQDPRMTNARNPSGHPLLGTAHQDTNPGTVSRGDLIVGQGTSPTLWTRLPLGAANRCLMSNGFDAVWNTCLYTGYPAGSIPFVDGAGNLAHNNNRLFWDNSARRLGVGTSAVTATLTVHDAASGTGSTTVAVRAGDGQGTTALQRWLDASGVELARVEPTGAIQAVAYRGTSTVSNAAWQEAGSNADPAAPSNGHAWYNVTEHARKTHEAAQTHVLPQVICSTAGAATSSTTATSLGRCRIPAALLRTGDRFDIRAELSHEGAGTPFSYSLFWGGTVLVSRSASAAEEAASLRSDATAAGANLYWSAQSWGNSTALQSASGSASGLPAGEVVIDVKGQMSSATSETVTLRNLSVVRLSSQANP
jgi:hypothetical protein